MNIVPIFAPRLFAFHFELEKKDAYNTLLSSWYDTEYIHNYLKKNSMYLQQEIEEVELQIIEDIDFIEDTLHSLATQQDLALDTSFKPLSNQEYQIRQLSRQKGPRNYLRIYAIRIDTNCFAITGGAIKLTQTMQGHPDTERELARVNTCYDYLKEQNIFDTDSFNDYLKEQQ